MVLESKAFAAGVQGASASNGLGDPVNSVITGPLTSLSCGLSGSVAIKHFIVKPNPGSQVQVSVEPAASGDVSVGAWVRATIYPISVEIDGLVDPALNRKALIGQALRARVVIPEGFPLGTPTGFQWTVPATMSPFHSFAVATSSESSSYVGIAGTLSTTTNTINFRAGKPLGDAKVRCSISFLGATLTGLNSNSFECEAPRLAQARVAEGRMYLRPNANNPTSFKMLGARIVDLDLGHEANGGILWLDWVATPSEYGTPLGQFDWVQLIDDFTTYQRPSGTFYSQPKRGWGLDGGYPYNLLWEQTLDVTNRKREFGDDPGFPNLLSPADLMSVSYDANFQTYLVYIPQTNSVGAGNLVALRRRDWSCIGNAQKIGNGPAWIGADTGSGWIGGTQLWPAHPVWTQRIQ